MAGTHNPIIIRKGLKLGELAAEADQDLLRSCFVDNGVFSKVENVTDPAAIVVGRTGAGKSAIVFHAAETFHHSVTISPEDISIRFLEHSNIIQFLSELGLKLDIFYRALWRHVIVIELLKMRYSIRSAQDGRSILTRFTQVFDRDPVKRKAKEYLDEWSDKFWLETDEQLKEITRKLDTDVRAGLGVEYQGLSLSANAARTLSEQDRVEVASRATRVVSAIQIKKLEEVIRLLVEHAFNDQQKRYFILIDKLDEEWAGTITRCRFIRALIEEIKFFRSMPSVKIVVAIRDDLLELVYDRTKDAGFQEEKYESYMIPLRWSREDLRRLLELRVNEVFRRQYTGERVGILDVFPTPKKRGGENPVDFMVDRTLHRPRDLLQFANESFALAHDRDRVSWRVLQAAEATYSKKRVKSLFEEWDSIYPALSKTIELLRHLPPEITRSALSRNNFDEVELELAQSNNDDPCVEAAKRHLNDGSASQSDVLNSIIQCLYRCGAIGIKISSLETFLWSFIDHPVITVSEAKRANQIKVHLMLHHALDIHVPVLTS